MSKCIECENNLVGLQKKFCSPACKQRHHWHRVKEQTNTRHSQTVRGLRRKLRAIEMKGGCCQSPGCGYNKNLASMDFHHRNPEEKSFSLDMRSFSNRSWEVLKQELEKCDLLCRNCHGEEHHPDLEMEKAKQYLEKYVSPKLLQEKKSKGKPNCLDCGAEINYTHKRCRSCSDKAKRVVDRPESDVLKKEIQQHSQSWCASKYGVSRKTIYRWLNSTNSP